MAQQKISTPSLEARHRPSGLNSRFTGEKSGFTDYVIETRAMITEARVRIGAIDLEQASNGNSPFQLKPAPGYPPGKGKTYKRGVLLVHGLTDSPYFMRHLGKFFQEQGFRVMAILLPGHGTQPGDMLDVSWQEWAKAVAYGCDRLAAEADDLYLAGFSTGGTLSVYHSLRDKRVRGLFLFSPAFGISPRAAIATWHKLYSWLWPRAKWVDIKQDKDIYKYESFPKNAAAQLYALIQKLHIALRKRTLSIPVFAAASADDSTVITPATVQFMAQAAHASNRLVLYTTDIGKPVPNIAAGKLELVNSALPAQKILSSAHTAIVLPPTDAHYGASGSYSNALHYFPGEMEKYDACINKPRSVLQGEVTEQNLQAGTMRRLMYNPNFAALKISMQKFIETLP
ncbi:MAG: alpha/beta fold hydrolase [Pseudomonadota bacterium]